MMARQMLSRQQQHPMSISRIRFRLGTLLVCARRRWRRWKSCYGCPDQEPVIQLNPEEIMDYQFWGSDPATRSGEGTLWKKNILMGGKCQLPDFSGVIMYDSAGNVVAPATTQSALPALTWK